MATKTKAHRNTFSTNFFGVIGYLGSSMVWLLVLAVCALLLPSSEAENYFFATLSGSAPEAKSPVLVFLLYALLVIIFWAFTYVASRVLSRVVRRVAGIFTKKLTADLLFRVKYSIHALGVVILTVLLIVSPLYIWTQTAIVLLGIVSGLGGIVAIALQRLLAKRHKVLLDHIL